MRETLNLTGGSLTINYDPLYNFNVGVTDSLRSGPISAQFSGAVSHERECGFDRSRSAGGCKPDVHARGRHAHVQQDQFADEREILVSGDVTMNPWNTSNPRYTSLMATISGT